MRKLYADLIQQQTTTAGTGVIVLTQVTGWAQFSDRFANGDRVYYMIESGTSKEVGLGTYGFGALDRTEVLGTIVGGVADWSTATALTLSGTSTVRAVAPEALFETFIRAKYQEVVVNSDLEDGNSYGVAASGLTLQLSAVPEVNDRCQVVQAEVSITGTVIDPNGSKINGVAGSMTVDIDGFDFWLVYTGASYGWKME
jgi:hypothetical protein